MTHGEKLKEARRQFGWSQEELAEKLYVSRNEAAKWETQTITVTKKTDYVCNAACC